MSGLGEPLSAEIEILSATPDELAGLTAAIAPEEAYTLQGLDRPSFHNLIKVEVRKKSGGTSFIKLTTSQPVTDPFLDMLVQVDFPTGRLVREFTLLLDPPDYANSSIASPVTSAAPVSPPLKSPSVISTPSSSGSSVSPEVASNVTSRPARNAKRKAMTAAEPVAKPEPAGKVQSNATDAASGTSSDIMTARGDSLARIARQNQADGVNLDQMLIGIYRANKTAFVDSNINRLKVGQIIRIPTTEELQSISAGEAAKEVRVHSADWQAYRSKLAGTVAETPVARDEAAGSQQSSAGKITAPVQDKSLPEVTGPRDVVKLSKNDAALTKSTAENKGLQDKLSVLQEESIAREKSIKEANERTALLEKQIEDMKKLLAMKSQAMADIQKNAATAAETPKAEPTAELAKAERPEAETPKEVPADTTPAKTEQPPVAAPAAPEKPKPVVKPALPIAPPAVEAEEPSFLDGLMENPLLLGLSAALITLLAGWLVLRNKRRRGLDGFEKSILTSGGLKANTVFGNTLGGSVNTGDTSFLTDFSQSSSGMIDTNDVDPIAEAEVYMAYGRDKQAEEILRDAISKEPTRYELHMKLLEVYAGRNDIAAFETTAGELYTSLGAQDPVWAKVAELGRQIEPENPLYQGVSAPALEEFTATNSNLKAADFAEEPISEKPSLDFSLDAGPEEVAGDAAFTSVVDGPQNEDSVVDFDLGEATQADEPSYEATTAFNVADKESELDFQLDLGATEEPKNEIEFDLASPFDSQVEPDLKEADSSEAPIFDADAAEATMQMDMSELRLPEASLEAGEAAADTEQYAAAVPSETLPDFDISTPPVDADENQFDLDKLPEFEPTFESAAPEISFDLPDPVIADVEDSNVETVPEQVNAPADIELPSFEPSAPFEPTISPEAPATEDIVFDSIPEQEDALDLDLDFDLGMPEDEPLAATVQPDAPEIDLSGISFDLDEAPALSSDTVSEPEAILAESSEVDTKLDLVTAYIDMGDNEGAKELLDEILQEGGPNQRLRAQDILKTLD